MHGMQMAAAQYTMLRPRVKRICLSFVENWIETKILGNEKIVEVLLEKGVDVNAVTKYGQTPLHVVAGNGNWTSLR